MLEEIQQQPDVINKVIEEQLIPVKDLCSAINKRDIRFAYIAARGASDNVANYAKYILEIEHGIPVALAAPSVFTLYNRGPKLGKHALVIGVSQSGEGLDVLAVCEQARKDGALTACITNNPSSPLAHAVEHPLCTVAGPELSVVATKTYTTSLALVALLSAELSEQEKNKVDLLRHTADFVAKAIEMSNPVRELAEQYKHINDCLVIARGYNLCTSSEIALNITETSMIGAKNFSAADFQHGPIAMINEGYPVILIAAEGKGYGAVRDISEKLSKRKPSIILLTHETAPLTGEITFRLPDSISEWLSPIVYAVPGQLFAHWLAIAKGNDPDKPRGLSKVTKTR
jgi:glucosamine--fructose-6-phosphate aminotransferase (isomerizing)